MERIEKIRMCLSDATEKDKSGFGRKNGMMALK